MAELKKSVTVLHITFSDTLESYVANDVGL
jgi:hypothetical protein